MQLGAGLNARTVALKGLLEKIGMRLGTFGTSELEVLTEVCSMEREEAPMKKFECLVKRDRITQKIVRYFDDAEAAFAWLELEGYQVFSVRDLTK